MLVIEKPKLQEDVCCYHCGEPCFEHNLKIKEKSFCCNGCKTVYEILSQNNLCGYYGFEEHPGIPLKKPINKTKFSILDNKDVREKLISFSEKNKTHITFLLPNIHCSSCIWILENLQKINSYIINSRVNFLKKDIKIIFNEDKISLKEIADLLTVLGYEPFLSYESLNNKSIKKINRKHLYKIGISGFCFFNIMMLSFPEYFSIGEMAEQSLKAYFNYLSLLLAIPVVTYCSSEFYFSAWAGLKQKFLNIDAPIALAILITFSRSLFELFFGSGSGYFDSMSGIVFFMLLGRYFQNITYDSLSFERNFESYFPISVTKIINSNEIQIPLSNLKKGDVIAIHNQEIIPVDAILKKGKANIDYSFVSGESEQIEKVPSEIIYAGGKHVGKKIELEVCKEIEQSYLTSLWNHSSFKKEKNTQQNSFIHTLSKNFSIAIIAASILSFSIWMFFDSHKALNALTTPLIVACPCALLLAATFANGNGMRVFSRNKFYLKNSNVIEDLAKIDTVIFDKTGTLTFNQKNKIAYQGKELNEEIKNYIYSLVSHSNHTLSNTIKSYFKNQVVYPLTNYHEELGLGLSGIINGKKIKIGSAKFTNQIADFTNLKTTVFVTIDEELIGMFSIKNTYREGITETIKKLSSKMNVFILSGDNEGEKNFLSNFISNPTNLLFNQSPHSKLQFIEKQKEHHKILMVGDGLNDAGALQTSNVGIAVSDDINNFSPACDAILDSNKLVNINSYLNFAKDVQKVIKYCFAISLVYNVVGLSFAFQGILSPVVAAIIMPASTVTIVLFTTLATNYFAKRNKLI